MVIQRMFHNRQSQAAAARLPRTRFIDAVEAFGQTRNMLGSNPRTVILNAKFSAMHDTSPAHRNMRSRRRMVYRVIHQV